MKFLQVIPMKYIAMLHSHSNFTVGMGPEDKGVDSGWGAGQGRD